MDENEQAKIQQYAGIKDNTGKEIYDGDIVSVYHEDNIFIVQFGKIARTVISHDGQSNNKLEFNTFYFTSLRDNKPYQSIIENIYGEHDLNGTVIIGNIFETPGYTQSEPSKISVPTIEPTSKNTITTILKPKESGKEMLIEKGIVYLITNLVNNKKYVGITTRDIETRWKEHKWDALNSNRGRSVLRNSIVKYGIDNFKIELVDELYNITEEDLLLKECHYIEKYKTMADDGGYNLVRKSNQKLIISEETKRKMSIAHSGKNNGYYGKKHTDEIKEKMRGTRESVMGDKNHYYGKTHTDDIRTDISKKLKTYYKTHTHGRTGKTFTEESRRKMSLAQIGKQAGADNGFYDGRIFTFQHKITRETFAGTGNEFLKKYNLSKAGVSSLKTGYNKSCQKWIITKRP